MIPPGATAGQYPDEMPGGVGYCDGNAPAVAAMSAENFPVLNDEQMKAVGAAVAALDPDAVRPLRSALSSHGPWIHGTFFSHGNAHVTL